MKPSLLTFVVLTASVLPAAAQLLAVVRIVEDPQPARVGAGDDVMFRVRAEIAAPHAITRYEWRRNGVAIAGAPSAPELTLRGVAGGDAGTISVMVYSTAIGRPSRGARLDVVQNGWALLSGRELSTRAATQAPSLVRCDGRWLVAWAENSSAVPAVPQLRVSALEAGAWQPMSTATLPGAAGAWATDPSLHCASFQSREQAAVVWTEAAGSVAPKTLHVKRFDGATWQPVGAPLASGPTVAISRPTLRLAGEESDNAGGTAIATLSLRTYANAARLRHERWDGAQWVLLGDAPAHTGTAPMVLPDTASRPAALMGRRALAPLQLANVVVAPGQSRLAVVSSQTGWAPLGDWLRPASSSPVQLVGLGFGAERSLPRAVAMWREGGTTPSLVSATLAGADYQQAFESGGLRSWPVYADPLPLPVGSLLIAHDGEAHRTDCDFGGRSGFGVAVADSTQTQVWFPNCPGAGSGTARWFPVGDPLPLRPAAMTLKMQDRERPLVALVQNGRLEVWRWVLP